jgi:hypothetical protein
MATVTMLDKARQGRRSALASLTTRDQRNHHDVVSIFDFAFDEAPASTPAQGTNVIAFRSARHTPAPHHAERRAA